MAQDYLHGGDERQWSRGPWQTQDLHPSTTTTTTTTTKKLFFQKSVFHFQFQQKMQKLTFFEKTVFQFFLHISGHI